MGDSTYHSKTTREKAIACFGGVLMQAIGCQKVLLQNSEWGLMLGPARIPPRGPLESLGKPQDLFIIATVSLPQWVKPLILLVLRWMMYPVRVLYA